MKYLALSIFVTITATSMASPTESKAIKHQSESSITDNGDHLEMLDGPRKKKKLYGQGTTRGKFRSCKQARRILKKRHGR